MQVGPNTVVSLRYRMKNSAGDVLEDTLNAQPVEYLHGRGTILPVLEAGLAGLGAGDTTRVSISHETSFQLDASFYFDVVIDNVRPATEEELATGKPAKAAAEEECGPGCIC